MHIATNISNFIVWKSACVCACLMCVAHYLFNYNFSFPYLSGIFCFRLLISKNLKKKLNKRSYYYHFEKCECQFEKEKKNNKKRRATQAARHIHTHKNVCMNETKHTRFLSHLSTCINIYRAGFRVCCFASFLMISRERKREKQKIECNTQPTTIDLCIFSIQSAKRMVRMALQLTPYSSN